MKTWLEQQAKLSSIGLVWQLRRDFFTNPSPIYCESTAADCRVVPDIHIHATHSKFYPLGLKHRQILAVYAGFKAFNTCSTFWSYTMITVTPKITKNAIMCFELLEKLRLFPEHFWSVATGRENTNTTIKKTVSDSSLIGTNWRKAKHSRKIFLTSHSPWNNCNILMLDKKCVVQSTTSALCPVAVL